MKKLAPDVARERRLESSRRWREANLERKREAVRRWRAANPGKALDAARCWKAANPEHSRLWHEANPQSRREANRRWQAANPDKQRRSIQRWREANPAILSAHSAKRRALTRGATVGDPKAVAAIYEKAKSKRRVRCAYCGRYPRVGERHVDHVIPLAKGGPHTAANLRITCAQCNLSKGVKTAEEFLSCPPN
ncbi:MAG: HNH endonuclease [Acidobacteriia bacterium]|nr:HNH endonuclease [Terriglobia bacterium]